MKWNFLKKCWPLPSREAHRPHRRKSQPAQPRARLWLEELESRTVPTTITRTSAAIFYNDFSPTSGPALTSAYAAYQITNTDGVNYADVWATIGNFTAASGPVAVTLGTNAASSIDLGSLANGQTKTAFFYLGSNATTTVNQTHTVSVFNGPPTSGALLTSQNFSFAAVLNTINASSNKVNSVVVSPSSPTVGGNFTITVTGATGEIGAAKVLDFTPAAYSSWRADALQLIGTTITLSGGNTGTFTDTLAIPPGSIMSTANTNYTAVYTFQVVGPTAAPTAVSPVAYISSGGNVKHADTGNFSSLPPVPPPQLASPTLSTTPSPDTVTLGTTSVTLTDTADLENGFRPTGSITFTLVAPGGGTVDTETVTVNGNGIYTTPTGFTLPSIGTATGTYQWNATYRGDRDNNAASDINDVNERVTVSAANPILVTTPGQRVVALGVSIVTLTDTALLSDGYHPTGTITFTLVAPNGTTVDTETVAVNGNGDYTTPTGFTLKITGGVTGTYQWNATYTGDSNNNRASDLNDVNEQVTISKAGPTITTTPNPTTVTLGTSSVTLTDSADLEGGSNPTGIIIFTLVAPGGGTVDTETVAVSGNGSYTTPTGFTLPTSGTVTGTYQWNASYSGDNNDNPVSSNNDPNERVTVSAANPTLITTPSPNTLAAGVTLKDTAFLALGYHPTGTITFTLFFNGGTLVDTETVTVNGNGSYTTPTGFTPGPSGVYQWDAAYSGDASNNPASDVNDPTERVTVTPPALTLTTTPSPATVTLGASFVTLNDTADLEGGVTPTGTITFELFQGSTLVHMETVAVNGNGAYTTPTGFTLPSSGTATGTYQWDASYSGDANNGSVSDNNAADEQVTVNPASPIIITTPSPTILDLSFDTPLLTDSATLAGGYHSSGTITFTLFQGVTLVDTETVTVNGNGTYTTPNGYTLPSAGTVTGLYQWDATYSGDANNNPASDINDSNERVAVIIASPSLHTIPVPDTVALGTTAVTLNDVAQLVYGYHPTGTITFDLFFNGGTTAVDTETVTVNGNGIYTTPTGFTLPTTVPVTGTYRWAATYSGDANNNPASESTTIDDFPEQVTVRAANPTLSTSPSPDTVTLGTTSVTLKDTADLENGYHPTGTLTFTLVAPGGGTVDTETVTVNGNGIYTTPTGFTLAATGTVTGTYQWNATYRGDTNNNAARDVNSVTEQVTVSAASPTLVTTANPTGTITLGTTSPTLNDTALLAGGYNPTGMLLFTLKRGGATVFTQSDAVTGNGTYTTAGFTLPTTGAAAGTYTWTVAYSGDGNNNTANDQGGAAEQVSVSAASPTLTTAPNVTTVTLSAMAPPILTDTATLSGAFDPTGDITFELFRGSTLVHTEMVAVSGNGPYTTPTGFTLPTTGAVAGAYQWVALYGGDGNNMEVSDSNPAAEQVTVIPASPTLVTTASPTTVALPVTGGTLTDSADLEGGQSPTGSIVFTLTGPGGFSYTQTDTVNGNATYSATLPTALTTAGTYTWTANYEGDANNSAAIDQGGTAEQTVVNPASLTLVTIASPNVTLPTGPPGTVTLSDSAFLSGGQSPTGTIVFTLTGPGGFSYTQTDTVSGDGTYTASTTLPTTVTVAGAYTWKALYSGDANNSAANDQGGIAERTVVSPASPTLVTTASPLAITLGTTSPTLNDTALVAGGYNPSGTLLFTLKRGGVTVFTQTDTVTGNGTYTTAGFTLPTAGTATGTYTWTVAYSGDGNNNAANDQGGVTEQTVVSPASPMLVTTASKAVTLPTGPPGMVTLSDSAVLSGGYFPTGNLVFTLTGSGGFSQSQTDTVSGNGPYTASITLPTTGTVAGTYTWSVAYGGNANNNAANDQGGIAEQTVVSAASPTLTTTPNVTTITLGATAPPLLTDTATLSGGFNPTGDIAFELFQGSTLVHTEMVAVSGNGAYTTPTGFTLPTSGTVAGAYQWVAVYSGDDNNVRASDSDPASEQVTVSAASPTLTTAPNVTTVTLTDTAPPLLTDTADLEGGYFPTGTITFELFRGSTLVDTEMAAVSDNGAYTTPTGFTLPVGGTAAGTYQWVALYTGDGNNGEVSENNPAAEQVTVNPASPTLVTTASPTTVALPVTGGTLTDSADLEGGFNPTGSIVFTLTGPGGFSYTQTDTVNGNATYSATLPTALTTAGTYTWTANYEGDANNNGAADQGGAAEQTVVGSASPTLVTIASPNVTLPTGPPGTVTLRDSAFLSGGQSPTGAITFTLTGPGGFSQSQTDTVSGNGTYSASTTLPTTGTAAGTYTWSVAYSGDGNNNAANDQGGIAEQTVVGLARPAFVTIASPAVTLPTGPPGTVTLRDAALLLGGYFPTGTITFTLTGPRGFSYTQTDTVSGNGSYTASTTLPTTVTVAGTYTWKAAYSGDTNNAAANDQGGIFEQTVVRPARPTIVTTASPDLTLPTGPPGTVTLSDSALLSRGYFPTGNIVFTLTGPGSFLYTQTDTVSGNGRYTASTTLPTTRTVAGTYTWTVAYSGDGNNNAATDQGGAAEQVTVSAASPTLTTTPNLTTVTLTATAPPLLTDTADLEGGYFPTGDITFELFRGSTLVHTEMVAVSGNGPYTTPTGFTLPTSGTVAGTYQWVAVYGGDGNNGEVSDSNPAAEQVTVNPASPTLVTTASPTTVALPVTGGTLTDSADLEDGFNPTGSIVFTLTGPGGFSYTQTDTVNGNATYSATLPTALTTAGTYTWTANYEGDANNAAAIDQGGTAEQTVVGAASLTLVTIASPNVTLPTGPPGTVTLSDSAFLSGGQSPTGSIVFTLTGPRGFSFTEDVTVSGNGSYTASTTLPTTVTVAGTYTWKAAYSGDGNNSAANDQGGIAERTVVSPASPTLVTFASPAVTLPAGPPGTVTLRDSALLSGAYYPGGSIVFTLSGPGGFSFTQTDTVTGNGSYSASTLLPTTGTVAGTYTWTATYGGDGNNNAAADQGGAVEQTVVSPASPTLVTTAGKAITRVGNSAPTLTDSAVLSGGYFPTGSVVFTLTGPNSFSFTQTDTVSGNGTYSASATLPTTVAGVYTWMVTYGGDTNNNTANDQGGAAEQVTVAQASPTLTTTPSPTTVTLVATALPILTDSATLAGGISPTGFITFTLVYNNTTVDTERVTVSGNDIYTTPTGFTLPSSGPVTGTYQWNANYSGDPNNNAASDDNAAAEQVTVAPASPTLTTTPSPTTVTLGTNSVTLTDTAVLSGGYHPSGTITFTLFQGSTLVDTETVIVSGNGTYTTPTDFTVPTTGAVTSTYQWEATYSGDTNNTTVSDNNAANERVVVTAQSDLVLQKMVSPAQVMIGFNVTYTFVLHNNGPTPATNVVVTDPFPAGLTLVGPFLPSQGTFDPATGVWTVGTLATGATATLTVVAQVDMLGPITNNAQAGADQFDPDLSNSSSNATVTGLLLPSMISKQFFLSGAAAITVKNNLSSASSAATRTTPSTPSSIPLVSLLSPQTTVPTTALSTAAAVTAGNTIAASGSSLSVPASSALTTSRFSAGSGSDLPTSPNSTSAGPSAEEPNQPSLLPVSVTALSDPVFALLSAPPRPVDAFPADIPAIAWEFIDLDGDVSVEGLVSAELWSRVPSRRADVAERWDPERFYGSASLGAEGWGLGAVIGSPVFLWGRARDDENRRDRPRSRRQTLRS